MPLVSFYRANASAVYAVALESVSLSVTSRLG